jgi:aminopeptidase N
VEPYFECLRAVWDGRSIEIASRIVRGLYPLAQDLAEGAEPADHPVVGRTDQWLADNAEAPRALRRIIVEQRSHLLRALTAQAQLRPSQSSGNPVEPFVGAELRSYPLPRRGQFGPGQL